MYRIINVVDGKEYIIHDQRDRNLTVLEPHLILTLNKTGTLEFKVPPEHMYYDTLRKLKSAVRLMEDGELIYEGRIILDETDFYNMRSITCEGCLAFFLDSIQRPFTVTGKTPREFLQYLVESHNSQVEERKRFTLGQITVTDDGEQRDRENRTVSSTWAVMKAYLLEPSGGYLWVSYEDGKKVLNYTWDYGGYNEQEIRFGVNLLDLEKHRDATGIITRVIPTGADVEYTDELGEKQTRTVDITSVNGGKDYLDADESAVEEYGIITGTLNWPEITDPEKLKMKAEAYLKESIQIPETLKISAVDLNYAGVDIQRFRVGRYTKAVSRQHGLEKELLLAQLDLYLDDPRKGSISLGGTQPTLTSSMVTQQANLSKTVQKVAESASAEINRKVENATNLITGGFGGYVVLDSTDPATGKKMHPWRILVMNTPDKDTATNVIQINQNGIGFSTTGINGPYRNAWTIDGNLVADFITTGTMLADRIRGGTMELGGSGIGRDGRIVVRDVNDREIGYWDKTGLHVLRGVIEGTDIIGGTIDIGDGTFRVNRDGSVDIESGEVNIGPIYANDRYVDIGGFRITDAAYGAIISTDTGRTIGIYSSENQNFENGPAIVLSHNGYTTRVGYGGIVTNDIFLNALEEKWEGWGFVSRNIVELWDRIENIERRL